MSKAKEKKRLYEGDIKNIYNYQQQQKNTIIMEV